jgi:hypothetical protein
MTLQRPRDQQRAQDDREARGGGPGRIPRAWGDLML